MHDHGRSHALAHDPFLRVLPTGRGHEGQARRDAQAHFSGAVLWTIAKQRAIRPWSPSLLLHLTSLSFLCFTAIDTEMLSYCMARWRVVCFGMACPRPRGGASKPSSTSRLLHLHSFCWQLLAAFGCWSRLLSLLLLGVPVRENV